MTSRACAAALRVGIVFASSLVATLVHADEGVPVYGGDANARFGHPRRIIEPAYPMDALREGRGGAVTATGAITPAGVMESPTLVADTPAAEEFVGPLRNALGFWLFDTPYDRDCMPSTRPVSIKVEFEVRERVPHIYATVATEETTPAEWAGSIGSLQKPALRFPRSMIQANREAVVFARSEVGPDGAVMRVFARAFPKPGVKPGDLEPFVDEVQRTLSQWAYPKNPAKPLRKVCNTVLFNLVD